MPHLLFGKGTATVFSCCNTFLKNVCRDPREIGHHEYKLFYKSTFKHFVDPLAWHHFSGDADGVAFKGIIFVPPELYVSILFYFFACSDVEARDSSFWAA